jgi:hypothetical protein
LGAHLSSYTKAKNGPKVVQGNEANKVYDVDRKLPSSYQLMNQIFSECRSNKHEMETWDPKSTLLRLRWDEIKKATNNFSPENIIGRGSSGAVYKGVMPGIGI